MPDPNATPFRRFTNWPGDLYRWKVSAWDHRAHAYLVIGDPVSEAICGHVSSMSTLIPDDGRVPECLGCMVVVVQQLPNLRWPE